MSGQLLRVGNGAVVGLVFGLSEAILFSMNAWGGGQWGVMGLRLILTVPMHAVTGAVTAWAMGRGMGLVGVGMAMVIHGLFNQLIQ